MFLVEKYEFIGIRNDLKLLTNKNLKLIKNLIIAN